MASLENTQPSMMFPDLDVQGIQAVIPHRYPMLMLDRLTKIVSHESAVGIKNVTANEWFFPGHFPENPIMPGVLIVEGMAQAAGTLVSLSLGKSSDKTQVFFMAIDEAKFRRPVVPGDTLFFYVTKDRARGNVWKFKGEAKVNDVLVAEATFTAMISDR